MYSKEELKERLAELDKKGYGKNDLARELEYAIIEEIISNMEDNDICKQDIENVSNGLIEYIFEVHIDRNLEDYIISKGE